MINYFNKLAVAYISAVICIAVSSPTTATVFTITGEEGGGLGSNFTMLFAGSPPGTPGGITGGATDIDGTYNDSLTCNVSNCNSYAMALSSSQLFFNQPWTARAIRIFVPGTYTIDTDCTEEDMNRDRLFSSTRPGKTVKLILSSKRG